MSRAITGDYKISDDLRLLDTEEMYKYKYIYKIDNYELFNLIDSYDYILGYFIDNTFKKVAKLYFNKIDDYYEVDTIYVSTYLRDQQIASKLYIYFAKNCNYNILGSNMQRFGARRLWARLSKNPELTVDIIDFENNIILETNTEIYHGNLDEEFDKRVWSYDVSMKHIRLLLKYPKR